MHEASAAEALVKIVSREARERGLAEARDYRVSRIGLVVGEATGYMRESLEFYVAASARGTPAEGAALDISYVKPRLRCPSCGLEFERRRFTFECPSCGEQGVMTKAGREFYVDSIEIRPADGGAEADGPPLVAGEASERTAGPA
jgi:hydrogenase nickel incorporation protein HypA/HybF